MSESQPAEWTQFVAPDGHSQYLRIEDDGDRLTVHPLGFPKWFVWIGLGVPAAAWVYLVLFDPTGFFTDPDVRWLWWLVFGLTLFILPANVVLFHLLYRRLNARFTRSGPFFTLDRSARTLTLPRSGRTLTDDDVLGFVQVHGWHETFRDRNESSSSWIAELSVLARTAEGGIERLPVVAALRTGKVDQLGEMLATTFDRPRHVIRPGFRGAVKSGLTA